MKALETNRPNRTGWCDTPAVPGGGADPAQSLTTSVGDVGVTCREA